MRAFEAIAETLARLGADTAFGLLGSGNYQLVERLTSRHGASYHWARHETAAVTMADAWGRVTGRVGICSLHQGPGLTNAMTGIAEAAKARTPLLVLVGEVATTAAGVNQRIDQDALARAAGAGAERVARGRTAVRDTLRAWERAVTERRPIVLSMPVDVQGEESPAPEGVEAATIVWPAPAPGEIRAVAQLVAAAQRPLVIGGRGALHARAQLELLADRTGALLATSAPAHGLFAGSPRSVGISGGFASPRAQELLPQADLVLAFGCSLTHWTTRRGELIRGRTVRFDVDAAPGAVVGDAATAAQMLAEAVEPRDAWAIPGDPGWPDPGPAAPGTVHPQALMQALDARLPADRQLATDAGHFQGYPPMHLRCERFVMTQSFQSVGLGLATGIGAAIARPDRLTVAVVGDGGLMMALGELDSAAASGLPLLVVVMDDGAYGAEVHHFGPMGDPTALVEFGQRDFAGVARALGLEAHTVRSLDDLAPLDDWTRGAPFVLDCKVDPDIKAEWLQEAFKGGA